MESITAKLLSVVAVFAFGAHTTVALAQTPAHTPSNNTRHAQEAGGGQGTHGARSPAKNEANNAYKKAIEKGLTPANKPKKPQKPKRPQKDQ